VALGRGNDHWCRRNRILCARICPQHRATCEYAVSIVKMHVMVRVVLIETLIVMPILAGVLSRSEERPHILIAATKEEGVLWLCLTAKERTRFQGERMCLI